MMAQINNMGQWAEFGLMGMVIGALFVVVGWFLRALSRKDEQTNLFIKEILQEDREERGVERTAHTETTNRLSDAINELTSELRNR